MVTRLIGRTSSSTGRRRVGSREDVETYPGYPILSHVPLRLRNQMGTLLLMDAALHAIADPGRRALLEALRRSEATAGELAELLPIARPGVSRHLRVLRDAGLVEVRQEG